MNQLAMFALVVVPIGLVLGLVLAAITKLLDDRRIRRLELAKEDAEIEQHLTAHYPKVKLQASGGSRITGLYFDGENVPNIQAAGDETVTVETEADGTLNISVTKS